MLELIRSVPGVEGHRLVAADLPIAVRMLRYLQLPRPLLAGRLASAVKAAGEEPWCLSVLRPTRAP